MKLVAAGPQDSDDLEALFDSIVAGRGSSAPLTPGSAHEPARAIETGPTPEPAGEVASRIGQLTRALHDAMREVGYDKIIARAADSIPDARDRLHYIATMTESAASRVLAATEAARPLQQALEAEAAALAAQWDRLHANELSIDEFKALAASTRVFLHAVPARARATNLQLTEIVLAQDFQDLTGQVIKRMTEVAQQVEQQLLELLIDQLPAERKEQLESRGLAGPDIRGKSGAGPLKDQAQVDSLLESLGF
jgi:chemotaxis protein CheZ